MKESTYTWNEYMFQFKKKAANSDLSPVRVEQLLIYAKRLFENKVPIIYDIQHLCYQIGYKPEYILRATIRPQNFYRIFSIRKKNGNKREITEPLPGLKEIQYWILENVIKKTAPNSLNNAYLPKKSIISNAKFHRKQPMLLNVDIEKYFDNMGFERVFSFFNDLGYNKEVSSILCKLVTLNNGLPQGSPSSPYLSSILTKDIDLNLLELCKNHNLRYSRYADDISISGSFKPGVFIQKVKKEIKKSKFSINPNKTNIKYKHQRQIVTGVIVNEKLSVKKELLQKLRQEVYYVKKFGLESHMQKTGIDKFNYLYHLLGKSNFYLSVRKGDKNLLKLRKDIKDIIKLYN
ncbi:MAG: reverse transcriptase family protein [Pseudosphingobacterium sp.]|nr:reverse transcriptase family protein [Pseudosphingobacterium sp.]